VDGYDLIGIGYPTHAFNAPKIIYEFISSLPLNSKKRVFLFRSAGDPVISAGGTSQVRSHLDNHGLRVFYERLFIMSANVFLKFNNRLSKQLFTHVKYQVSFMIDEILSRKIRIKKYPIWLHYFSSAISKLENYGIGRINSLFYVNGNCNQCLKCVKLCPIAKYTYDR